MKLNNREVLNNDAVILLFTQGWQRLQGVDFADTALHSAIAHFTVPLQNARVDVFLVDEEWKDMVGFAKQYLSIVEEDYPTIWWKLLNSAYSKKWKNILSLVELIFCLPMSNGHVEHTFSLKLVKTNLRNKVSENHLDDLLRIAVDSLSWGTYRRVLIKHRVLTKTFQTRKANKINYYAKIPFALHHIMIN